MNDSTRKREPTQLADRVSSVTISDRYEGDNLTSIIPDNRADVKPISEEAPTFLSVLQQHYPEIIDHKINTFCIDYCIRDFFDIAKDRDDFECSARCGSDCTRCWKRPCTAEYKGYEDFEEALYEYTGETDIHRIVLQTLEPDPDNPFWSEYPFEYDGLPDDEMRDFLRTKAEQIKEAYTHFKAICEEAFSEAQDQFVRRGMGNHSSIFNLWIDSQNFHVESVHKLIGRYKEEKYKE